MIMRNGGLKALDYFGAAQGQSQIVGPPKLLETKRNESCPENEPAGYVYLGKARGVPNLLGWIRRFRKNPVRVYCCALVLVATATLVRLGLQQQLSSASPFAAYSIPLLCMALAGGFYPGIITLVASVVTGSILFLPPAFSFTLAEGAGWPLLTFVVVGSIQVILVSVLVAIILS